MVGKVVKVLGFFLPFLKNMPQKGKQLVPPFLAWEGEEEKQGNSPTEDCVLATDWIEVLAIVRP